MRILGFRETINWGGGGGGTKTRDLADCIAAARTCPRYVHEADEDTAGDL